MSDIGYFSEMFHRLGDLTIELNNALNLLVRSYRTEVPDLDQKEAKSRLVDFFDLALGEEILVHPPWIQPAKMILETFLDKKGIRPKLELIRKKIDSGKQLTKPEIRILDDLILQISQQATIAFRKMKKAS